jgi:hypothetical protein
MINGIEIKSMARPKVGIRCQMINLVTSFDGISNVVSISDITPNDFHLLKWQMRNRRRRKFEHADLLLMLNQKRNEMRADEAGSAGNENQGLPASVTTS